MVISLKNKKLVACVSALAAVVVVAIASGFIKRKETVRTPVNLNETLVNAMSDTSSLEGFDKYVKDYMTTWGLKGASLSVMRNDSLLFAKGYGMADTNVPMRPGNILRMASVSKLVTAVGIMILQEREYLSLKDQVFGPGGILDDSLFNAAISDSLYMKITVEDLLRHKGGFSKKGGDPMFSDRERYLYRKPDDPEPLEKHPHEGTAHSSTAQTPACIRTGHLAGLFQLRLPCPFDGH